jgi:hypothetical protein
MIKPSAGMFTDIKIRPSFKGFYFSDVFNIALREKKCEAVGQFFTAFATPRIFVFNLKIVLKIQHDLNLTCKLNSSTF